MENIRIFWWALVIVLVLTTIRCTQQGIQPNPIYRVVNRRLSVTHSISRSTSVVSSTAALVLGVLFGGLVYWACLYMCCEKCE